MSPPTPEAQLEGLSSGLPSPFPSEPSSVQRYCIFTDDQGQLHIVDGLEQVPSSFRTQAKALQMESAGDLPAEPHMQPWLKTLPFCAAPKRSGTTLAKGESYPSSPEPQGAHSLPPWVGFSLSATLGLGWLLTRNRGMPLISVLFLLVATVGAMFSALQWLEAMGRAHPRAAQVKPPQVLIDRAKQSSERLEKKAQEQLELLKEIEEQSRGLPTSGSKKIGQDLER